LASSDAEVEVEDEEDEDGPILDKEGCLPMAVESGEAGVPFVVAGKRMRRGSNFSYILLPVSHSACTYR
jgi:hypothetical protein